MIVKKYFFNDLFFSNYNLKEEHEKLQSAQEILAALKNKTDRVSKVQEKKLKEFIDNVETPLKVISLI